MNLDEVLRLPLDEAILFIRGQNPLRIKKMDYSRHPLAGRLVERDINDYLPPWAREMRDGLQLDPIGPGNTFNLPPASSLSLPKRDGGGKGRGMKGDTAKGGTSQSEAFFPKPVN